MSRLIHAVNGRRTMLAHVAPIAMSAAMILSLLLGGCGSAPTAIEVPIASLESTALTELGAESTTVTFDVAIANTTSAPISLQGTAYRLVSNAAVIGSGREDLTVGASATGPMIAAKATQSVPVKAVISSAQLLAALPLAKGGENAPFEADVFVQVDTTGAGPVTLTVKGEGMIPIPASMGVEVQGVLLEPAGGPSDGWAGLGLINRNGFAVQVTSLNVQVTIDERVSASGTMGPNGSGAKGAKGIESPIAPGQMLPLDLPIALQVTGSKPRPGSKVSYTITGTATVTSSRGTMTIPLLGKGVTGIAQ